MTTTSGRNINFMDYAIKIATILVPVLTLAVGWGIGSIQKLQIEVAELKLKSDDIKEIKMDIKESKNTIQEMNLQLIELKTDFQHYKRSKTR